MTAGNLPLDFLLAELTPLIHKAGALVMGVYATDFDVEIKDDESPVTVADQLAEKVIFDGLSRIAPGIPIVGEEAASTGDIPDVSNLLAPALGRLFGGAAGLGAWVEIAGERLSITTRAIPPQGLTVVGSRHHGDDAAVTALLAGHRIAARRTVGSSLKLCLVAEGAADVYPRFGRTMEWDIAAGDAVLRAAGGTIRTATGEVMGYGKPGFENADIVAWGRGAMRAGD